jgi:hypothetical protein
MRRMTWSGTILMAALATAALASAAQAAPAWQCNASASWASVEGNPRVDPVTAGGTPCVSTGTGVGNVSDPTGLPAGLLSSGTTTATTTATPAGAIPAYQEIGALGRVENLAVGLPAGATAATLTVRAATSRAAGVCSNGQPTLTGSSEVLGASLDGQEIPLEQLAQQLSAALAPLGDVVDLKVDEQVRDASSLTQRALHLRILSGLGTPVLEVVAGEARVGSTGTVCDPAGQTGTGGNGAGSGSGGSGSSSNSANSAGILPNGVNGGTCGRLTMHFVKTRQRTLTSRYGQRAVVRGRIVNCKGKAIVRARIDVVHVVNGQRRLVKTGLRSREGGKLTLILPMNLKTRDIRFEYRGNLRSSKVTSRSTLHVTVRNRVGRLMR